MLPLKSKPVVRCSQNTNVEGIDELVDPMRKKTVYNRWIVCNTSIPAGTAVLVIWAKSVLPVQATGCQQRCRCEEDRGLSQST